ncbi:MAG: hypothetical protein LWW93_00225 [Hyphomicrobiales bacterium]|nr:hypothetical protein [Hyphomicrobiales bacterium]
MKTTLTRFATVGLLIGAVVASTGTANADPWRHHHRGGGGGDAAAAAAFGLVGGMILGGALAQSAQPDYGYEDEYVVRRAPSRVYYEDDYAPSRRGARCRTFIKHDMYGKPYEFKDCDP